MVYAFLGQDALSKDIQIKKIKEEFLAKGTEQFNFDILYARELTLDFLQEKLLFLPVKSSKRIVLIKDAQGLNKEIQEFFLKYVKEPYKHALLILDFSSSAKKDEFINAISKYVKILRFKEDVRPDTFVLSRQIESRRPDYALRILNQLLEEGEKPERILGGLRYVLEKNTVYPAQAKRKFKLLLNCDIEIKTGKLKPSFALEKLVVSLCNLIPSKN